MEASRPRGTVSYFRSLSLAPFFPNRSLIDVTTSAALASTLRSEEDADRLLPPLLPHVSVMCVLGVDYRFRPRHHLPDLLLRVLNMG